MNVQRVQDDAGQDNAGVEWVMWDLTHTADCCGLAVEREACYARALASKWAHKKAEWDGLSSAGAPATHTAHAACHVQVHVHVHVHVCVPASPGWRVACVSEEVWRVSEGVAPAAAGEAAGERASVQAAQHTPALGSMRTPALHGDQ